jgi:putative hemolysin
MENYSVSFHKPGSGIIKKMGTLLLEKCMGISKLNKLMKTIRKRGGYKNIGSGLVRYFNLDMKGVDIHHLEGLTDKTPLLVVANHPYGLPDGAMIAEVLLKHLKRKDYKFFVGHVVTKIFPELKESGFSVENLNLTNACIRRNARTFLKARKYISEGGMVVMFPAGQVSGLRLFSERGLFKVGDFKWDEGFMTLAKSSKATILPVHLGGHNSKVFLFWRLFGKMTGRLCLFREFMKLTPREVDVTPKKPLEFKDYNHLEKGALVKLLRKEIFSK